MVLPLPSLQAKVPISEIKSITLKVINAIQIITTPPDCPKGKKVRPGYAQLAPSAIEPVRLLYDSDFFGLSSSANSTISVTGTTANGRSSHSMHSGESPRETPCVFHSRRASLLLACLLTNRSGKSISLEDLKDAEKVKTLVLPDDGRSGNAGRVVLSTLGATK